MPLLTPQQQQEEERREQERLLNARFFNKQKWRYRRIDKPWEEDDELDNMPGLATAETLAKLLKPGVYKREEPMSPYYFRLTEDGCVKPLSDQSWLSKARRGEGVDSDATWKAKYKQAINFLVCAKGETTLMIDFPSVRLSGGHSDSYAIKQVEKYLDYLMDMIDEINKDSDVKIAAQISPHVSQLLDSRPHLHEKYAKRIQQQRMAQAAARKPEHDASLRNLDYKTNQRAIAQQEKLSGSESDKKQQFEQAFAAGGQDAVSTLGRMTADLNRRLAHAEMAMGEVAGHIKAMPPASQAAFVQENGVVWQALLSTVAAEQADLQTRAALVQEKIAAQKATIEAVAPTARTPEQTAQLTRLQQMEEKLQTVAARTEKLKNGDANTAGCDLLQQKVDDLIQTTAPRARR